MQRRSGRRTVVAGVDGSPEARRAVRWAAAEAARREVPLRLVTAFPWCVTTSSGIRARSGSGSARRGPAGFETRRDEPCRRET